MGMETAASQSQLMQYIPVVILGLVAVGFAGGTLLASIIVGKRGRDSKIKDTAYECGMLPVGDGSTRLSVKFYLVAMLFILFDIEVVFLYPWAVIYRPMLARNAARSRKPQPAIRPPRAACATMASAPARSVARGFST